MNKYLDPQPGVAAKYPGICPRCPEPIRIGDRVFYRRGQPVHVGCQSGGDDE